MDELNTDENNAKFNKADLYFKVDRNIVNISEKAISEKALKTYLLHCRRVNPNKNMGCSFAGANDIQKLTGIPRDVYDKTIQELIDKYFVVQRPDVKTGWLKAIPIEISTFPLYDSKNRRFSVNTSKEHQHRKYSEEKYINIPNVIIDKGYLKKINTVQTLLTLLKMYNKTNMKDFYGVDFRYIHVYCHENLKGYKVCEKNKYYSTPLSFDRFETNGNNVNCSCVNQLAGIGLIAYIPALIYQDQLDPDNAYVKKILEETEKTIEQEEGDYEISSITFPTPENEGERVIEILRPKYLTETAFINNN